MAGQRRRPLDADHPRVGIRDRRERAHRDEPAGHRHRDVGRGAAHAGRQGGGERPRGGSGAGCRRPLDRSEGRSHRCGRCRSDARMPAKPSLADGQEIFAIGAPLREQKGMASGTVSRVEAQAIVSDFMLRERQCGRAGLRRRRRRRRDHLGRRTRRMRAGAATPGSSASTTCATSSRLRRRR